MTAALSFDEHLCWGTNGAIEDIVGRMASLAADRYGEIDPVAILLAREFAEFWTGKVVEFTSADVAPLQFHQLLSDARAEAISSGEYTDTGEEWLNQSLSAFCEHVRAHALRE